MRFRYSVCRPDRRGARRPGERAVRREPDAHANATESDLDLVYVGTENDVIMIEGSASELPEADFVKALEFAHGHAREMIRDSKGAGRDGGQAEARDAAAPGESGFARYRLSSRGRSD